MSQQTIPEILKEINSAKDTVAALKQHLDNNALKFIFGYGYIPKALFLLPRGECPYKENVSPIGTTPTNLTYEAKRLEKFCNPAVKSARREVLFIQTLENMHKDEARVLVLVKDQILETDYPNITLEKIVEAGFFPMPHFPEGYVKPQIIKPKKGKKDAILQ
jgi:hypothetical protein